MLTEASASERMSQFHGWREPRLAACAVGGAWCEPSPRMGLALLEQAPQDLRKLGYVFMNGGIELLTKGVGAPFRLCHII